MKYFLIILFVSIELFSCSSHDSPSETTKPKPDSAYTNSQAPKPSYYQPLNKTSIEDMMFNEYAKRAVDIPKRILDSAMRLKNVAKINNTITIYAAKQDLIARKIICERYHVTNEELNRVLKKKEKENMKKNK
jgi:hypothetical protein